MRVRFLHTTPSSSPEFPFQAGQIIPVEGLTKAVKRWIESGFAEVVREEPELATMRVPERAVSRGRK